MSAYLEAMGIVSWHLRQDEQHSAFPAVFSVQVNDQIGQPIGLILADCIDNSSVSIADQKALLEKIAGALSADFTVQISEIEKKTIPSDLSYVILLGESVSQAFASKIQGNSQSICSLPLSKLYQSPVDKKALWMQLKPLCL